MSIKEIRIHIFVLAALILAASCSAPPQTSPATQPQPPQASPTQLQPTSNPTPIPSPKPEHTPTETISMEIPIEIQMEEYAVYRAVIEQLYSMESTQQVVITRQTGVGPSSGTDVAEQVDYLRDNYSAVLNDGALEDYVAKNSEVSLLEDHIGLAFPVEIISLDEIEGIFASENGWDVFYERFPGSPGLLTFSRVGFDPARQQALVYAGQQSHYLAGSGHFILLTNEGGEWRIEEMLMAWIS